MNTRHIFACLLLSLVATHTALSQGPLTPTDPPGPTMKALDQIASTGIPLDARHVTGNANYEFVITEAGNYYLTGNLAVNKPNGIRVTAPGVTIDLNGFEIRRSTSGGLNAIAIDSAAHRCVVKNGSINWPGGSGGVRAEFNTKGGAFRNLTVTGCNAGLQAGEGWLIEVCRLHDNVTGIATTGSGTTITNCVATRNETGISAEGGGAVIINCSSSTNTGVNGTGISVASGTVTNCLAVANGRDGIVALGSSIITNNNCEDNGVANGVTDGAGIHASGAGNRIEANNTVGNDIGIRVENAGNFIIKNSNRGGTDAYDIAAGNAMGQEINVFDINGGTVIINSSNSWANFLY